MVSLSLRATHSGICILNIPWKHRHHGECAGTGRDSSEDEVIALMEEKIARRDKLIAQVNIRIARMTMPMRSG
jgi:hypothetical protein